MKIEYNFENLLKRCQFNFSVHPGGEFYCQAPAHIYVWGIMGTKRKWIPYEEGFWLCQQHFDLIKVREDFNKRYKNAEEN